MNRNLLTLSLLVLNFAAQAQILTYVGKDALFYVSSGALVYNGGTVQTVDNGVVDNSGNIMIDNGGGFYTKKADGTTDKADADTHANLILRLTDKTTYNNYGQLWIATTNQSIIKGYVDKEYLAASSGTYQQFALPFNQKEFNSLSSEFKTTLNQTRWSKNEILAYNNAMVRADNIPIFNKTNNTHVNYQKAGFKTEATTYYQLGSAGFKTNAPVAPETVFTLRGVPYAAGITKSLSAAGAGLDFGVGGKNKNWYKEFYNSYLQDNWAVGSGFNWDATVYGKDTYQYGNPFFTNLDLTWIGTDSDAAAFSDKTFLNNLWGVRFLTTNVVTGGKGATTQSSPGASSYITFAKDASSGSANAVIPTGNVGGAIIKPMQAFVIKMKTGGTGTLSFDDLRRFAYTPRSASNANSVTAAKGTKTAKSAASTVKQIGLIALDENGNELGRTYYVVYNGGTTGAIDGSKITTQVAAETSGVIGTFEEKIDGGIDPNYENSYWLYINEANQNDYVGKEIPVGVFDKNVKSIMYEIRENAQLIADKSNVLTNGESFYIMNQNGAEPIQISQGQTLPLASSQFGLYYGKPNGSSKTSLGTTSVTKPSSTVVVLDQNDGNYKVLFDNTWKVASVSVYDMSGKLVSSDKDINAQNNYTIRLPKNNKAVYIVTAVSETGKKYVQKIKN